MARYRWTLAMLVLGVLMSVAPQANGAAGTPITTCGQTVTTNAFLSQDLVCSGHGVIVGSSGVTIDLGGFALIGDRDSADFGIWANFDEVTVKNGVVRNFGAGVAAGKRASIVNVVASGNGIGIY